MRRVGKIVKTGISFPSGLLEEFDSVLRELGIGSRSRGLQEAVRTFISANIWKLKSETEVAGVILVHYSHDVKGLEEELTDIQHDYMDVVASALHLHLTGEDCLQVVVVRGPASKVKDLMERIRRMGRLKQLLPVLITID